MKENIKKILIIVLIVLLSPIFIYLLIDGKNLFVDIYNFNQLEKAKPYLETIDENTKKFYNLKEFNEKYNAGIVPIKNCYFISNSNGSEEYIFGFKLESYIYIYIYGTEYYAYPKYYIPYQNVCMGGLQTRSSDGGECFDGNRRWFERIISNPCRD